MSEFILGVIFIKPKNMKKNPNNIERVVNGRDRTIFYLNLKNKNEYPFII
jgi:hypothetical protein